MCSVCLSCCKNKVSAGIKIQDQFTCHLHQRETACETSVMECAFLLSCAKLPHCKVDAEKSQ